MADAKFLKDGSEIFFPIGHTQAIFNSTGETLDTLLTNLDNKDISSIEFNSNTKILTINFKDNSSLTVNISVADENTVYTNGAGLDLNNNTFSVKTGYSDNEKNYGVKTDTNGNLYVNVPWTSKTYSVTTKTENNTTSWVFNDPDNGEVIVGLQLSDNTSYETIN